MSKTVNLKPIEQYHISAIRSLHIAEKERMHLVSKAGLLSAKFMINSGGVSSLQSFRKPAIPGKLPWMLQKEEALFTEPDVAQQKRCLAETVSCMKFFNKNHINHQKQAGRFASPAVL